MKFRFKPEDFEKYVHGHECPKTADNALPGFEAVDVIERPDYICAIANSLLEAHEKTLGRVLGITEDDYWLEDRHANKTFPWKYTALLYDVEGIKGEEK